MHDARHGGVGVGIDESGEYCFLSKVNLLCSACGQLEDFRVGPDSHETAIGDGYRLGARRAGIYSKEFTIVEDEIWLGLAKGE